jgi:hypothetical protein
VSEGTARNKLPAPRGVSIPHLKQQPSLQHRAGASAQPAAPVTLELTPEDDKTTAYKVPEELLRRARTGFVPVLTEEDNGPDSGAITAPPPVETSIHESRVAPRAPGVPQDLLMSLRNADHTDDEEVVIVQPNAVRYRDADETDVEWDDQDAVEFPRVQHDSDVLGRALVAANDGSRRGSPARAKPGVAPTVLWMTVFAVAVAVMAFIWLIR